VLMGGGRPTARGSPGRVDPYPDRGLRTPCLDRTRCGGHTAPPTPVATNTGSSESPGTSRNTCALPSANSTIAQRLPPPCSPASTNSTGTRLNSCWNAQRELVSRRRNSGRCQAPAASFPVAGTPQVSVPGGQAHSRSRRRPGRPHFLPAISTRLAAVTVQPGTALCPRSRGPRNGGSGVPEADIGWHDSS
jgi:hypothetical protein